MGLEDAQLSRRNAQREASARGWNKLSSAHEVAKP
jgi:hypothetical protein